MACQCKRGSNRLRFGKPKVASPGCSESAQEAKIKAGRGDGEAGCEVGGVFYIAVWVNCVIHASSIPKLPNIMDQKMGSSLDWAAAFPSSISPCGVSPPAFCKEPSLQKPQNQHPKNILLGISPEPLFSLIKCFASGKVTRSFQSNSLPSFEDPQSLMIRIYLSDFL